MLHDLQVNLQDHVYLSDISTTLVLSRYAFSMGHIIQHSNDGVIIYQVNTGTAFI